MTRLFGYDYSIHSISSTLPEHGRSWLTRCKLSGLHRSKLRRAMLLVNQNRWGHVGGQEAEAHTLETSGTSKGTGEQV